MKKMRVLLGWAVLAVATSTATVSLATGSAHAEESGCGIQEPNGQIYTIPVGNEWIEMGEYTVVVRDGKVFHRHRIWVCGRDLNWRDTGRYVDLEVGVIGCCPRGGDGDHEPILT